MKEAIICFTRVPIPGKTKIRLLPLLSEEACAAAHTAFLRDVGDACAKVEADVFVCCSPGEPGPVLREIFSGAAGFFPQEEEGLGRRMHRALERVLFMGYDACLLIGSDLPELTAAHLRSAFDALRTADVVLGPTPDGGYYLIGLKAPCEALFSKQTYSNTTVYARTVAAAKRAGLSVAPAMATADVDTPEDLRRLWLRLDGSSTHTARYLGTIFCEGEL